MRACRRFLARLGNCIARRRADQRLLEEMELHLSLQTAANLRAGMSPAEARRQALLKLGGRVAVREDYRNEQSLPFIDNLLQDLRYALRLLAKSPGFTAAAVLTMALGIGATTAIFSVVNATLLHPLSFPDPDQLVRVEDDLPGVGAHDVGMSEPEWKDLQRSGLFQYVSIIGGGSVNLTGSSHPARIFFASVSPNYLASLGVKPQLGRWFDPNDQTPGFNLEVVISDGLWKRLFGGDPGILGRNLRLDNDVYRVVGVMPPGFHDARRTAEQRNVELWAATGFAAAPAPLPQRHLRVLQEALARLKPGLTIAAAQSRLDALVAAWQKQYPADYPLQGAWTIRLVPLQETVVAGVRQSLILLLGAVGLVLLIGCVNIANLLLARATARGRELAVRQALGAAQKRLVRQLLSESLVLSLLGGLAGLAILFGARGFLLQLVPDSLPRLNDITISWSVLVFALGVSIAAGVIFGLVPALQTSRLDVNQMLRQEGRGSQGSAGQSRARHTLVVTEFALSLVLMIAAGLLLRSFWELYKVRPGFNPQNVMAVQTWLPVPNDPATDPYQTAAQETPFLRQLLRRTGSLPGVEAVAIGNQPAIPLDHDQRLSWLFLEGAAPTRQPPLIQSSIVTPPYFDLLGIPLHRGRLFNDFDDAKVPRVAVINEAMARTYWPAGDCLGRRFRLNFLRQDWITVIGVIADARTESLAAPAAPTAYLNLYQTPAKDLAIFLRGRLDPAAIPAQVRAQVQSVDPQLPVFRAEMLDDALSASLSERRFSLELVASFAVTALLLAALGIYGTISYLVGARTREIGIRLALGAQRAQVLHMVLRQGLDLVLMGAVLGLVAALAAARLMAGLLYGVSPADPFTFVSVTVVLAAVALAACYVPARRATRVDPVIALRYE